MAKVIVTLIFLIFGIILLVVSAQSLTKNSIAANQAVDASKQKLDASIMKFINGCSTFTNPTAIQQCGTDLVDLRTKCKTDPAYFGLTSCNDPQLEIMIDKARTVSISPLTQSNSTLVETSTNKLNTDVLNMINICSSTYAPLDSCKLAMLQTQSYCKTAHVPACDDERILEILNKTPTTLAQQTGDIVSQSNQQVSDYLGMCLTSTQQSDIQICVDTANKMINLCNSMQGGIPSECSDQRLQQVANMKQSTISTLSNYNSITSNQAIQQLRPIVNSTSSAPASSCPTQLTHEVVILKNSVGNSLFNPQILNLNGGDYVIFKSSDEKPHLLTSYDSDLRDWFIKNGALINNKQTVKLRVMIFGYDETFLNVYDDYDPNISITLDVKPTQMECSK